MDTRPPPGELVRLLCKGACRRVMVHRLRPLDDPELYNQDAGHPYYGQEAVCSGCGRVARDNYNGWQSA